MKKLTKKKSTKPVAVETPDAPEAQETQLIDVHSAHQIRVFDMGPLFGVENAPTGTVDLIPKDRVLGYFRRSGTNIAYHNRGFGPRPEDPAANVTIEEIEEICTELTDTERQIAQDEVNREKTTPPDQPLTYNAGELQPPAPRETAPAEKRAEAPAPTSTAKHPVTEDKKK